MKENNYIFRGFCLFCYEKNTCITFLRMMAEDQSLQQYFNLLLNPICISPEGRNERLTKKELLNLFSAKSSKHAGLVESCKTQKSQRTMKWELLKEMFYGTQKEILNQPRPGLQGGSGRQFHTM